MPPTISVLCPAYNEAQHLDEMLMSLRTQSLESWEALLIDDGSTDGTAEIMQRHASADSRIKIVSVGERLGKVRAFNMAFDASRADLICMVGADDVLPPHSLRDRVSAFSSADLKENGIAFFKFKTFSNVQKFDGLTLPRGRSGSRSGPSITFTRPLAEKLFPVDERLPSEDLWLGYAGEELSDYRVDRPEVVLFYRIHSANSNPRHKPFAEMSQAMHDRLLVFEVLLKEPRFNFQPESRLRLASQARLEEARFQRQFIRILFTKHVSIIDRLATVSMANPLLYKVRMRFYRTFTGLRGR